MTSLFPFAAEAGEVEGIQVLIPPVYEIFWSAVVALLIWLVVGRWGLPRIYKMLDDRRAQIDEGLDAASKADEQVALAQRERDELLRAAAEEAKQIREGGTEDARRIVAEARARAVDEAARITEAASRQIAAERQAAASALRQDVGGLATQLAEKIVGEQLKDKALSARVIDRFMDDLEDDLKAQSTSTRPAPEISA